MAGNGGRASRPQTNDLMFCTSPKCILSWHHDRTCSDTPRGSAKSARGLRKSRLKRDVLWSLLCCHSNLDAPSPGTLTSSASRRKVSSQVARVIHPAAQHADTWSNWKELVAYKRFYIPWLWSWGFNIPISVLLLPVSPFLICFVRYMRVRVTSEQVQGVRTVG